jgi:type IV secretory pathway VirB10-like protein
MKRFNQNNLNASPPAASESNIRSSLSNKRAPRRHYTKIGAAICAVIILHFVSQFVFFRDEKPPLKSEAVERQSVEVKPESKPDAAEIKPERLPEVKTETAKKPATAATTAVAVPKAVLPQPEIVPARAVIKKKEPKLSRAERLRRAERILTGV